jgi:hypothetical protein
VPARHRAREAAERRRGCREEPAAVEVERLRRDLGGSEIVASANQHRRSWRPSTIIALRRGATGRLDTASRLLDRGPDAVVLRRHGQSRQRRVRGGPDRAERLRGLLAHRVVRVLERRDQGRHGGRRTGADRAERHRRTAAHLDVGVRKRARQRVARAGRLRADAPERGRGARAQRRVGCASMTLSPGTAGSPIGISARLALPLLSASALARSESSAATSGGFGCCRQQSASAASSAPSSRPVGVTLAVYSGLRVEL